ncbi:hypothetical protein A0E43_08300 [Pectobacterium cacticida]
MTPPPYGTTPLNPPGVADRCVTPITAIVTALMLKSVFNLTLRALQGFIDSVFQLMDVPLRSPDYTRVSKRAKSVNVNIKTSTRGEIAHLVIDSTGLKVFGEGEWKVKKHGAEKLRVWRKLHLAVDAATHEIVCADLSNDVAGTESVWRTADAAELRCAGG